MINEENRNLEYYARAKGKINLETDIEFLLRPRLGCLEPGGNLGGREVLNYPHGATMAMLTEMPNAACDG